MDKKAFAEKVNQEGLDYAILEYFAPDLRDYDLPQDFKDIWARAYDALAWIDDTTNRWLAEEDY